MLTEDALPSFILARLLRSPTSGTEFVDVARDKMDYWCEPIQPVMRALIRLFHAGFVEPIGDGDALPPSAAWLRNTFRATTYASTLLSLRRRILPIIAHA